MKSTPNEERQNGFGGFDAVAFGVQKLQFLREKETRDFELHIVGELVEDELLVDACVKLWAHRLLGVRENVPLHRGK